MSDPAVISDQQRYAEVGREYRELEPAHELALEYRKLRDDLEGARELLDEDGDDPELRKVVDEAPGRLEELEEQIRLAMVERDPNDDKNVIVEIRAGTGGDEAGLFVAMLGIGIGWASMMGNPYIMLIDMIPPERNGVYMGIFNMFIVIPMIIESLTVPLFYHSVLGGEPRNILYLSGALMILGAVATVRVTMRPASGTTLVEAAR